MRMSDDARLAHRLADLAGQTALRYFGQSPRSQTKDDGSLVTEADVAVERALTGVLAAERPGDSILAEEGGASGPASERRWIIDPIDGTARYAAGRSDWGPHIALSIAGELAVAVLGRPAAGLRWWAERGCGAYRARDSDRADGHTRLRVSRTRRLDDARVGGLVAEESAEVAAIAARATWCEDALSIVAALVEGRVDAVLDDGGQPWDMAPAVLLTEEAGGRFCDRLGGRRIDLGWGLFTNAHLQPGLMGLLAGRPPVTSGDLEGP